MEKAQKKYKLIIEIEYDNFQNVKDAVSELNQAATSYGCLTKSELHMPADVIDVSDW